MTDALTLAILGGTGPQGSGLALRWARAGHRVTIGSRDAKKSAECATDLSRKLDGVRIDGASNEAALANAEIAILTVPYAAQRLVADSVRAQLQGKILIDVTVPLMPPKVGTVQLPAGGSAVVALQADLGDGVRVVSAFQNISAQHLHDLGHDIDCDVLVCGDDKAACETAIALAKAAGMRGWHAGPLANSAAAEALTSVLITLNRRYKIAGSGIRITGAPAVP
jgi:NADPH-dependent F420 reductase